jgi:hypothetical protein
VAERGDPERGDGVQIAAAELELACERSAPLAELEHALAKVSLALGPVLAGIARLKPSLVISPSGQSVALDSAGIALLDQLEAMLARSDARAADLGAQLAVALQGSGQGSHLKKALGHLEQYDFDAALEEVRSIQLNLGGLTS